MDIFLNQWKLIFKSGVMLNAQHNKWKTKKDIFRPIILNFIIAECGGKKKEKKKNRRHSKPWGTDGMRLLNCNFGYMENFKNLSHRHFWRCAHQNKKINQKIKTWDTGKMGVILGEKLKKVWESITQAREQTVQIGAGGRKSLGVGFPGEKQKQMTISFENFMDTVFRRCGKFWPWS